MNRELIALFEYFEFERGLKREVVVASIEEALIVAARKVTGANNVTVSIDPRTGDIKMFAEREVVDEINYPEEEILIDEALEIDHKLKIGDVVAVPVEAERYGRIAAQITRQVIMQKLRQAERDVIFAEYRDRVGELVSGTVKRVVKGDTVIVDLGKVEAILPRRFYPHEEQWNVGDRVLALLVDVQDSPQGSAEVLISRSDPDFVLALLHQEVPELRDGSVIVKKIVREAGLRTMVALDSTDPKVDPVGACVGMRGHRIKNILKELGREKVDLFAFAEDRITLLKNALAPIVPKKIEHLDELELHVVVDDENFAAALGKKGHHVRLISKLLEMDVTFFRGSEYESQMHRELEEFATLEAPILDETLTQLEGINPLVFENLIAVGFKTPRAILSKSPAEVSAIAEIPLAIAEDISTQLRKYVRTHLG